MAVTEKQKRFAFEYVRDFNGTKAALRAGYAESGAATQASLLLNIPEIQALIEEHKETIALVAQLSPAWVLKHWMQIAAADPSELITIRQVACKNCWVVLEDSGLRATMKEPNPSCESCAGIGVKFADATPTNKLSPGGRRLYAGAKQGKDGSIEIKMRDQDGALKNLAGYLGMMVERKEVSGPGGGPVQLQASVKRPEEYSEEELALIVASGPKTLEGVDLGVSPKLLETTPTPST